MKGIALDALTVCGGIQEPQIERRVVPDEYCSLAACPADLFAYMPEQLT